MNYNNYPAIGIDAKFLNLQNILNDKLGFANVDFYGRVQKVISKDQKLFTPEVHTSISKRKEVYYDGKKAKGGNVFFIDADKHTTRDGKLFEVEVKIVFMLNLEELFQDRTYRADSEVQDLCYKLIQKTRIIDITAIEKGIDNVLKGFNTSGIKMNDQQPYHTFSINGKLTYLFNC